MNKYPLARMLTVRELREDQAARALRHAQAELETAIAFYEARKAEAIECRHCMRQKEDELAEATVGRMVETGAARALRREVAAWRERMEEAEAVAEEAARAVVAAEEACEAARAGYQARMKDKHKIANHREAWKAEADKESEAAEEREMEEAAARGPVRNPKESTDAHP
jgi:type III secretion protein O